MEKSHESALFPGVMPVFEMTSEKGKYLYRYNYGANNAGNEMNKKLTGIQISVWKYHIDRPRG